MIYIIDTKKKFIIYDRNKIYNVPKHSLFQIKNEYPHLRGRPIVRGYIGPRGSGKSVNGSRATVVEYMIKNKRVWSNILLEFAHIKNGRISIKRSESLDKLDLIQLDQTFNDGLLFIEEINMEVADAYRAVSNKNLGFSYILQQLRKRQLDIIWNAQSENHVDTRLRFQTDIFVKCQDLKLIPGHKNVGTGELSICKAYDYSGIVTGNVNSKAGFIEPFREWTAWNKPWWNIYDTNKMQGIENEISQTDGDILLVCEEIAKFVKNNDKKVGCNIVDSKFNLTNKLYRKQIRDLLKNPEYNIWLDAYSRYYLAVA